MDGPDKNALLAWISADDHLVSEVKELSGSAGYTIIEEVRQKRDEPDPRFYLGSGKILELTGDFDHLILPNDLTPSQSFSIHMATGLKVVDRVRLILEIFRKGATSPESRIQVELADLHHQLPIVREYVHSGKLSEKPGFMAGGEYRVDYYFHMIKRRMAKLRKELRRISERREEARALRKRRGAHLVSLAGYTNAGKSTLLNRLIADRNMEKRGKVGDHVFTTISTTTRRMIGPRNCLVTDTVGFIQSLPPWLFEGFRSTLEEAFLSDIILLVLDVSDHEDEVSRKLESSMRILSEGETSARIILVANKIDRIGDGALLDMDYLLGLVPKELCGMITDRVEISARTGESLDDLQAKIESLLPPLLQLEMVIPQNEMGYSLLSKIRRSHPNLDVNHGDDGIRGTLLTEERWARSLGKLVESHGGSVKISQMTDLEEQVGDFQPL